MSVISAFSGVGSCVGLASQIITLLASAEGNRDEFKALLTAVQSIQAFLQEIPADGITQQGNSVLGQLYAGLMEADRLLRRVSSMGPLVSLLKATIIRDDFCRINRDITSTFAILAAGSSCWWVSQLLETNSLAQALHLGSAAQRCLHVACMQVGACQRSQQHQDAQNIQKQLLCAESTFFMQEVAALGRLENVAAAGKQGAWPEQLLQRKVLDQLQAMPEVSHLKPEELLAEYRALQLMAMYNGDDDDGNAHKAKKGFDAELEEFLLQQVCAALAPTVAASTSAGLLPDICVEPPSDFLCPISKQLMLEPAMLVETGHSYEAASIKRWLDMHGTCPVSNQQLRSKDVVKNYSLKKAIAAWAAQHGITLPSAPTYAPLHNNNSSSSRDDTAVVLDVSQGTGSGMAATAPKGGSAGQAAVGSAATAAAAACNQFRYLNKKDVRWWQCTPRKWAFFMLAVLLVAGSVGVGVGVYVAVKHKGSYTASSAVASGSSAPGGAAPAALAADEHHHIDNFTVIAYAESYYCLEDYKPIGTVLRRVQINNATATNTGVSTSGQVARQCAAACDAASECTGFRSVGHEVKGGGTCELLTNSTQSLPVALASGADAPWPEVIANLTATDKTAIMLRSISWMCWRQQADWDKFGAATHNMITAGEQAEHTGWCAFGVDVAGTNLRLVSENITHPQQCDSICRNNATGCTMWTFIASRPELVEHQPAMNCFAKSDAFKGQNGRTGKPQSDIWIADSQVTCFTDLADWRHLGVLLSPSIKTVQHGSTYYTVYPERVIWSEAAATCKQLPGGQMAVLDDQELVYKVSRELLDTLPAQRAARSAWVGAVGINTAFDPAAPNISEMMRNASKGSLSMMPPSQDPAIPPEATLRWVGLTPVAPGLLRRPDTLTQFWTVHDVLWSEQYIPGSARDVCGRVMVQLPGQDGPTNPVSLLPGVWYYDCAKPAAFICQSTSPPNEPTGGARQGRRPQPHPL